VPNSNGKVFLVGAGPGDPELLTLKARRLLDEADVVVYDRLVSAEILALVPTGVSRIFVGKEAGNHHAPQERINDILVRLARKGHRVVRLKGGDPFVFGRGGEEALHLVRAGVAYEVVPGVTAGLACTAYAGIPVTHRDLSRTVHLVAGHCRGDLPPDLDWTALAGDRATIVFYMALANLDEIRARLLAAGLSADTPAAIVESGTTRTQRCIRTRLEDLPRSARAERVAAPAVVVVGRVAELADELAWFGGAGQPALELAEDDAVDAYA